jgi:hypothetical protein
MGFRVVSVEDVFNRGKLEKINMVLRSDEGRELQLRLWFRDDDLWKVDAATEKRIYTFTGKEANEFFEFLHDVLIKAGGEGS